MLSINKLEVKIYHNRCIIQQVLFSDLLIKPLQVEMYAGWNWFKGQTKKSFFLCFYKCKIFFRQLELVERVSGQPSWCQWLRQSWQHCLVLGLSRGTQRYSILFVTINVCASEKCTSSRGVVRFTKMKKILIILFKSCRTSANSPDPGSFLCNAIGWMSSVSLPTWTSLTWKNGSFLSPDLAQLQENSSHLKRNPSV